MNTWEEVVIAVDGRYPITLRKGGYWSRIFIQRDSFRDRIDLTGYAGRAEVRSEPGGELLLTFQVTVEGGNANSDKRGEVLVEALGEDTALLNEPGVWDCRLFRSGSEPIDVITLSPVELDRSVTQ